jgi:hypothetical protein
MSGPDPPPFAPGGCVPIAGLDQLRRFRLSAPPAGEKQTADRHVRVRDCETDTLRLFSHRLRSGELAGRHARPRAKVEGQREHGERAGFAGQLRESLSNEDALRRDCTPSRTLT